MRIALFTPANLDKKLGAVKNRIEFAEALSGLGWETFLIDYAYLGLNAKKVNATHYTEVLRDYLKENAHKYDVVLYEYDTLPFDRSEFNADTLFIARPALLHYHLAEIKFKYDFKTRVKQGIKKILDFFLKKDDELKTRQKNAELSLDNCDIIQVQNSMDLSLLEAKFPEKQKLLIPNGIAEDRLNLFDKIERDYSKFNDNPKIAFVGTFDYRKGAVDFVKIVKSVTEKYPNVVFKFLGSKGLFSSSEQILAFFPSNMHKHIEIILTFEPDDLPNLLKDCYIGVFPSYIESFGYGALEMMCASLPVVGYRSPGPCDFLLPELSCKIGDEKSIVAMLIDLLSDVEKTKTLALKSRQLIEKYNWSLIGEMADQKYREMIGQRRKM